jgi:hypothetical protein
VFAETLDSEYTQKKRRYSPSLKEDHKENRIVSEWQRLKKTRSLLEARERTPTTEKTLTCIDLQKYKRQSAQSYTRKRHTEKRDTNTKLQM